MQPFPQELQRKKSAEYIQRLVESQEWKLYMKLEFQINY